MSVEQFLSSVLAIGAVQLPGRAILAPMSGVSDVVFRRAAVEFGASAAVTEMVASAGLIRRDTEARLRSERARQGPHIVQLVGRDPRSMAEAARLAEAAGADVVDINFGCPAKKVTGGLAGSALMREPDLAVSIVAETVKAVSCPVTVKMRLGWDGVSLNAPSIARRAVGEGVRAVTVHGRTRQQFYTGRADWTAIAAVRAAVSCPVVANGDVATTADARTCLERSGAAAVMVGRAAVGQPWLVGRIASGLDGRRWSSPGSRQRAETALRHYEGLLTLFGRETGVRHARKHVAAYAARAEADGYAVDPRDRSLLVTSDDPAAVTRVLARLFDEPEQVAA